MHATDVNPLFYSALLLSALPVPLLRQVPWGSKYVSLGHLERSNSNVLSDVGSLKVPRCLQGFKREPFGITLGVFGESC